MRTSAWLPGGGFLLILLWAGLLLLATDLGRPGQRDENACGGSWVRLVVDGGSERFVRIRPGESFQAVLDREEPGLRAPLGACCASLLMTPGTEVRLSGGEPGAVLETTCGTAPLPEGVRYLLGMRMDINRADPQELALLPGIGEVMAGRIVEERNRRDGFSSREDLLRVSGIGPKRLERIEPHVTFGR